MFRSYRRFRFTEDELAALRGVVETSLDGLAHIRGRESSDYTRMLAVRDRLASVMTLDQWEIARLRDGVLVVLAMRGYIAGRPQAFQALISLHRRFDQALHRQSLWGLILNRIRRDVDE